MYERFTDRARKAMALAYQEALRFDHYFLGPEHILLGLLKEGTGTGSAILRALNIDTREARQEVGELLTKGTASSAVKFPHTARAKAVIKRAIAAARDLEHHHVGTPHLLLALLDEEQGVVAQAFIRLGVDSAAVKAQIAELHASRGEGLVDPEPPGPTLAIPPELQYLPLTERVRRVAKLAGEEAKRLRHDPLATEHLLIGLIVEGSGVGVNVLRNLNVDLERVRLDAQTHAANRPDIIPRERHRQNFLAWQAVGRANREARTLGHTRLGTEHLVLGLLSVDNGGAAKVLANHGVMIAAARREVQSTLAGPDPTGKRFRNTFPLPKRPRRDV